MAKATTNSKVKFGERKCGCHSKRPGPKSKSVKPTRGQG